jgi:hypothetical protein
MECLGLHNKPKAEVHPGHKLTGPKEEEEEETPKLKGNVLFCRRDSMDKWKTMSPSCLEQKVNEYAHASLGHLGVDKCMNQIGQLLYMKKLGRKIPNFVVCCDLCQRASILLIHILSKKNTIS